MSIFRKEKLAKSLTTQDIIRFFSFLSKKEVYADETSKQWLWNKCNLIVALAEQFPMNIAYFLSLLQDDLSQKDKSKLMSLSSESVNMSVFWLDKNDKEINSDYELSLFAKSNVGFFDEQDLQIDVGSYKAGFVSSWVLVSLVFVGVFYLWNIIGFLSLLLLAGVVIFWLPNKVINFVKNQSAKRAAKNVINTQVVASSKAKILIQQISAIVKPLESLIEKKQGLKNDFDSIKNKTFYILRNIDEKYESSLGVELIQLENDLNKIWTKSMPDLIDKFGQTTPKDKLIMETTHAIELLLDNYLENILAKDESAVSVQKRYWLSKLSSQTEINL